VRGIARAAALAVALGFIGASPVIAAERDWTPVESHIWELERSYLRHLQVEDLPGLADFWHHEGVAWPSHAARPSSASAGRASLATLLESIRIDSFELHPLMIRVIGNVAVVHYRLDWEIEDADRSRSTASFRIAHTWLEESGRWRIVGGMSSATQPD
jgi:ketosteroid isomerase-like protein